MTDREGRQLGNYRLIRILGQGTFADVYLGQHVHLQTQAAVKMLHERLANTDAESFLAEARTIARLRHRHIVRVLDFGVADTTPFLVLEYAPHGNLRQRHPKGTLVPLDAVVSYVRQVAGALQYAHDNHLIHRDIKPENMLLGYNQEILLGDFGIAILAQNSHPQHNQDIAGTIAYMAPEQMQAYAGPASDQYALGIVVYEWLCGDRPFHGSLPEIAVKQTVALPPSLCEKVPAIPPAVERVVFRALARDPEDRFERVQDFAVALEEASLAVGASNEVRSPEQTIPILARAQPAQAAKISTHALFPPLMTLNARFNNLPVQLTSLIGREQEVAAVCTLLHRADVRLVTLTGTGGIGKTRLGLAVATALLDSFADGICFVPLASISDPALVALTIAHLLGLEHTHTGSWSALVDMEYLKAFLQEKHFLLVLDNFEQVVRASPDLTELLVSCPHLNILVTSRAALRIQGEHEFPVPPLAFPTRIQFPAGEDLVQYAAIALFLQRALAVKPDFAMTKANIHAIATICKHLDGLPLAIELAAARSKLLPPQALLQRLTHRLALLTGGSQNVSARQQTLRNTIAWSYDLLDATEQQLFRRLSVFVGGCTLQAIETICDTFEQGAAQVLDAVASLIDKSLLRQTEQGEEEPRLVMLETIREYGLECLASSGELEQTRRAHAEYYLGLAKEAEPHLYEAEQLWWFDCLEREHDNLRAVLNWSVEREEAGQRKETALRLAGVLVRFWVVRGYVSEGRSWLEQALANSAAITPDVRANALCGAGWLAFFQSDGERAEVLCEQGLQCYREARETQRTPAMASSLIFLGWLGLRKNDDGVVRFLLDESRALARDMGDKRSLANLLHFLAGAAMSQDKYAEARSLLEESVALFREMGDRATMAWALRLLGLALFALREKAHAYALIEESLSLAREMRDTPGSAYSLFILGRFALAQGDAATARPLLEESLAPFRAFGDRQPIAHVLSRLANVATQQGDDAAAQAWYEESLALFRQIDDKAGLALCLQGWGAMAARQGEAIWAAWLWGAAETLRDVRSFRNPFLLLVEHTDYEQADYERMVSTVRSQLGEKAFATAWAGGRATTLDQVLAKHGLETTHELAPSVPQPSRETVPTPGFPNGLTAREVEVLRLVAKGLTNNEIAGELGLSEKTIAHHLTHIFNKTSSENRASAAAFAIRHGLA